MKKILLNLILILLLSITVNAFQVNIQNTQLPYNKDFSLNISGLEDNKTYAIFTSGFIQNDKTTITKNDSIINFSLFMNTSEIPGFYNSKINVLYNGSIIFFANYNINLTYNTSLYNLTDNRTLFIENGYLYIEKYDLELPFNYTDTYRIKVEQNSLVIVECIGYIICDENNFTVPNNTAYYDYQIRWEVPFGSSIGTIKSEAMFNITNNNSDSIIFESKIIKAPIQIINFTEEKLIYKDFSEYTTEEWVQLLKVLETGANDALNKIDKANKTEYIQVNNTLIKTEYQQIILDDDFYDEWNEYASEKDLLISEQTEIIKQQRRQVNELLQNVTVLTGMINIINDEKIKEQRINIKLEEQIKKEKKSLWWTITWWSLFILVLFIIYGYWRNLQIQ